MSFLAGQHPRAFAHRGWHIGDLAGCENSVAAFRRAVDEGYHYLETDVHVTSDGVLIAFHDTVLDRVTNSHGPVAQLPFREVRQARIAGREPIPTLADVLAACPEARFNIDPKVDAAVGPLLDALGEARALDRVCVGTFSDRRLTALRNAGGPRLATSLGPRQVTRLAVANAVPRRRWRQWAPVTPRTMDGLGGVVNGSVVGGGAVGHGGVIGSSAIAAQVPTEFRGIPIITPRLVKGAHAAGMEVHAWTINSSTDMNRLLDMGVDGIMTDRPDVLRTVMRQRGTWE